MDGHAWSDDDLGVPASNRREVDKTLVADEADEEADLIGVSGQHHPRIATRVRNGNRIAQDVRADLVRILPNIAAEDLLNRLLVAGGPAGFDQRPQELEGFFTHGSPPRLCVG